MPKYASADASSAAPADTIGYCIVSVIIKARKYRTMAANVNAVPLMICIFSLIPISFHEPFMIFIVFYLIRLVVLVICFSIYKYPVNKKRIGFLFLILCIGFVIF